MGRGCFRSSGIEVVTVRSKTKLIARKRWKRLGRKTHRLVHDAVHCRPSLSGWSELAQRKLAKIAFYKGMIPVDGDMRSKTWERDLIASYRKTAIRNLERKIDNELSAAMYATGESIFSCRSATP